MAASENQKSHCRTRAALTCQVIIKLILKFTHNFLNLGRLDLLRATPCSNSLLLFGILIHSCQHQTQRPPLGQISISANTVARQGAPPARPRATGRSFHLTPTGQDSDANHTHLKRPRQGRFTSVQSIGYRSSSPSAEFRSALGFSFPEMEILRFVTKDCRVHQQTNFP
jgi:hypothetical protein